MGEIVRMLSGCKLRRRVSINSPYLGDCWILDLNNEPSKLSSLKRLEFRMWEILSGDFLPRANELVRSVRRGSAISVEHELRAVQSSACSLEWMTIVPHQKPLLQLGSASTLA